MSDPTSSAPSSSASPSSSSPPARPLPLAGVRVLDVSQVMAGPYACMLLADLGADVIKVEPPQGGDQTRGAMGFKLKGTDSMGFLNMNRNKRSITLDLKTESGRQVLYRMVKEADILVENYRPGVMKRLGTDYETLAAINPRLVYVSISGFGQTGPWAGRPGFDLMAQAMSGIMSVTGYPGGPPVKAGVPVADIGCALFATYGMLAAYIGAKATGRGQYVDASLFDSALAFSIWDISEYWGTGREPEPLGTANRMSAPYQAMKAADGHFVMGATNQKLWQTLCKPSSGPTCSTRSAFPPCRCAWPTAWRWSSRWSAASCSTPARTGSTSCWPWAFRPARSSATRRPSTANTASTARCASRSTTRSRARCRTSASR
jgi:crotonobetainyl-CoA:carnitine CoA-transferase CaiB-like acyl-CoA transferase